MLDPYDATVWAILNPLEATRVALEPMRTIFADIADTTTPQPKLVLPKRSLTPGAYNVRVRQPTIHRTICVPGYTSTIRPSSQLYHRPQTQADAA